MSKVSLVIVTNNAGTPFLFICTDQETAHAVKSLFKTRLAGKCLVEVMPDTDIHNISDLSLVEEWIDEVVEIEKTSEKIESIIKEASDAITDQNLTLEQTLDRFGPRLLEARGVTEGVSDELEQAKEIGSALDNLMDLLKPETNIEA